MAEPCGIITLVLYLKEVRELKLGESYTFLREETDDYEDEPRPKYIVEILAYGKLGLVPFYIKSEVEPFINGIYYHIFKEGEEGDFYSDEGSTFVPNKFFCFKSARNVIFEIDKWVCEGVYGRGTSVNLCLCDSMKPALGSFSERVMGMHSRLTDNMRNEMVKNLNSNDYAKKHGPSSDEENQPQADPISEITNPNVSAPGSSSPYALRGEHIRRSILNRGVDALDTIETAVYPWELDFAVNQADKWRIKVKSMVFSVVGALISKQVDIRDSNKLDNIEKKMARTYDKDDKMGFNAWVQSEDTEKRMESCSAPIWDSGSNDGTKSGVFKAGDSIVGCLETEQLLDNIFSMSEDQLSDGDLKDIITANPKDRNKLAEFFDMGKKSKLENLLEQRDHDRDAMVKGGVFPFTDDEESCFAENVFQSFCSFINFETESILLVFKDAEYPKEGFSYTVPTLIFGPSNSAENSFFSIGHGVNLLMEGTEIAASFLQYSAWAVTSRINSINSFPKIRWSGTPIQDVGNGGLLVNFKDSAPNEERPETFENCRGYKYYEQKELSAEVLASWLAANFLGYCYERPHVIDRPMFAKLASRQKIAELYTSAIEAGFVCTSDKFRKTNERANADSFDNFENFGIGGGDNYKKYLAKSWLFFLMKHEIDTTHRQTERRMRNIIQPFLVSVTSSSMGTGTQSYMHMEDWWGPKPDYFSVQSECLYILGRVSAERFQRKRRYTGANATENTLGEWFSENRHRVSNFETIIEQADDCTSAAAIMVRLIESVQSANEGVIDAGRTQRDRQGRDYVNQARFSYATQLLQLTRGIPN